MIIREFLRKKSTHIYILILSILTTILLTLDLIKIELDLSIKEMYNSSTIFLVKTEHDLKNILSSQKYIDNIREAFILPISNDYYVKFTDEKVNLEISNPGFSGIITYKYQEEVLEKYEISLGLDTITYENIKPIINNYIGATIEINYNKKYELTIKDIYDSKNIKEFIISNELYNQLSQEEKNYTYISKIKAKKYESEVEDSFLKYKKSATDEINIITFSDSNGMDVYEKLEDYLRYLKYIIFLITIMFVIIFIIVYKNLLEDLLNNILLEKILGYYNKIIKINIFKRLLALNIITLLISFFLVFFIKIILKVLLETELLVQNYYYILFIIVFELSCNLLLIGTINNKLNIVK